ncbi:MAG: FtsX-like permease family protein [Alphaproteobacteria bacterium]|nr:FtsX-like permease family protein [Alphaproteobacteria bacterium]
MVAIPSLPRLPDLGTRLREFAEDLPARLRQYWSDLRRAVLISAKLPLGVQQLRRQRTSAILALCGVTASIIVIFAQLGIENAIYESSVRVHRAVKGDLVVASAGFQSLQLFTYIPVDVVDTVAAHPKVRATKMLHFGNMSILHEGMRSPRQILYYGLDIEQPAIDVPGLKENLSKLRIPRRVLFDRMSRPVYGDLLDRIAKHDEVVVLGPRDAQQLYRQMFAVGTYSLGPNILNDGSLIMSDLSLAEIFGYTLDRPAFIAVDLVPGTDVGEVVRDLRRALGRRADVFLKTEFVARERAFWSRDTPIGYVTNLGFFLGVAIGMVFIYYAKYQIIRSYLPEYAILKCFGYDRWFFLSVVVQIGVCVILPSLILGAAISWGIYAVAENATHLGLSLGLRELSLAFVAAVIMTLASSVFALRRLNKVDPVMLFD